MAIIQVLRHFEMAFSERVWESALILLVGAILAPGKRTVTSALRVMGLSHEAQFQNYHRVLNRASWSSHALSRILLRLLVRTFVPADAPIVIGLDDHIERRWGDKIAAKGIYRDTVLAPSERYHQQRGRRHKSLIDWAGQMIAQVRRWLPSRPLVVVADSSYAALELLATASALPQPVSVVTRLRLDAALYDPAEPRKPGTKGAPRKKGARQPTLAQRLLDPTTVWEQLRVRWYGGTTRQVELASGTAVWYHSGLPLVPLRWVLIRDPLGKFAPQALLSTDQLMGWKGGE